MKRLEARLRLVEGELVLIGDVERGVLELAEACDGALRRLGKVTLAKPEELGPLFERLARGDAAPPSSPGPMKPFQPPPDED